MVKLVKKFFVLASVFMLAVAVFNSSSIAQEKKEAKKVDVKKIYAAIVGEYEVDAQGQITPVSFFVDEKSGKMWGGPAGQEEELAAAGETGLEFEVVSLGAVLTFVMEKDGKVNKFTVDMQGQAMEGVRVKKKKDGGR